MSPPLISKILLSFLLLGLISTPVHGQTLVVKDAQTSLIQKTVIASTISGVVESIHCVEGQSVTPGLTLVSLQNTEAKAELAASQAGLEAARLEADNDVDARYAKRTLDVHRREYEQSEKANKQFPGAISGTEMERLRLVIDQAELAIEQAEHGREVARAHAREKDAAVLLAETRLSKHCIQSLVSGIVAEVSVEPGEWVEQGQPVMQVISLDPIRVECFVDGWKHGNELVGLPVRFQLLDRSPASGEPLGNEPAKLTGKVTFVSSELNSVTGQTRLWASLSNPHQLVRAGMRGTLVIGEPEQNAVGANEGGGVDPSAGVLPTEN